MERESIFIPGTVQIIKWERGESILNYEMLLEQNPFDVDQRTKEWWYLEMLTKLTNHHKKYCREYEKLCDTFRYPMAFSSLEQIPMLPVGVFKKQELRSVCEEEVFKTITSSGTTGQQVSKIFLDKENAANQQKTLAKIMGEVFGNHRVPMIILDSPKVFKDRDMFSARGAGILGFSIMSSKRQFALDENMKVDFKGIQTFLETYSEGPVLVFGFTYMIWEYFYKKLKEIGKKVSLERGILIHGGGWKKMQKQAVSKEDYKKGIREVSGIREVYDYYGMAEQTGCIYLECPCGHLHASVFSDVLIRDMRDFSLCSLGEEGVIQVLSPAATSYPGHSILTEDRGILLGIDDCPCGRKGKYFKVTGRISHAEVRGCSDTYGL